MIGIRAVQLGSAVPQLTQRKNRIPVQGNDPGSGIGLRALPFNCQSPLKKIDLLPAKPFQLTTPHGRIQSQDARAFGN
jgi:hypothetical protein